MMSYVKALATQAEQTAFPPAGHTSLVWIPIIPVQQLNLVHCVTS